MTIFGRDIQRPSKRTLLISGGVALVLVIIGVTSVVLLGGKDKAPEPEVTAKTEASVQITGQLEQFEGEVQYRPKDEEKWAVIKEVTKVSEGDAIKTGVGARAVTVLKDGSILRLNQNTEVVFTKLTDKQITVTNETGEVYSRVAKAADRKFEVMVNERGYVAKGTAYRTLNTADKSGVEVFHSKVDAGDSTIVEEGRQFFGLHPNPEFIDELSNISLDELSKDKFIQWCVEEDKKVDDFKDKLGILRDLAGPALEITAPANNSSVTTETVEVKGKVEENATVKVNGEGAPVSKDTFTIIVKLKEGVNNLTVEAKDKAGNTTVRTVSVTRSKAAAASAPAALVLAGSKGDKGINLTWTINGIDVSKGFKLVLGEAVYPSYPGNEARFMEASARSYTWGIADGKTYHFRICQYTADGKCNTYSNDVTVSAPNGIASAVSSINLTNTPGTTQLNWDVTGTAHLGYKLMWSTTPVATLSNYNKYFSNSSTISVDFDEYSNSGTWYVRVCEYLGITCGTYSNEVTVTVP